MLDRNFIVENRTGGDGLIGIKAVKGCQSRRHYHPHHHGPTMYLLPMVETTPSFDSAKDFVPVSAARAIRVLCLRRPRRPADVKDFKQFVAWLKANPHKATFGVPATAPFRISAGSRLEQALGIKLTRVAYRGTAPIINDLDRRPFAVRDLHPDRRHPAAPRGQRPVVAVGSAARSSFLPDAPTLKESGVDLVADGWYGMWLPAGASSDFAKKLSEAAAAALAKPEVKEKLQAIGLIPVGSTPEGLTQELAANTAFWQPVVKATGYKITN